MENEIDAIIKMVENSEDETKIHDAFMGTKKENGLYEGGKNEEDIKDEWNSLERQIGKRLQNILENVSESEKNKEWFYRVQLIQGRFKEKFNAWWAANQKYTKAKTCIICTKKPNCLEKNWLTKVEFEKVRFCVDVYMLRGLKEPSES